MAIANRAVGARSRRRHADRGDRRGAAVALVVEHEAGAVDRERAFHMVIIITNSAPRQPCYTGECPRPHPVLAGRRASSSSRGWRGCRTDQTTRARRRGRRGDQAPRRAPTRIASPAPPATRPGPLQALPRQARDPARRLRVLGTTEWQAIARVGAPAAGRAPPGSSTPCSAHRRWHGCAQARGLVAVDPKCAFYRAQRRRQLDSLRAAARADTPERRAADAFLLYTLERVCDAVAEGESRALGVRERDLVALLTRVVDAALRP
jgi:hypothetical protein